MTPDQFLDIPDDIVSWDLAFAQMEGEMQEEAIERRTAEARNAHR